MSKKDSEYLINRKDNQYEVVIGLEVHAQVLSESKLFSTSATKFGAEPNTQVSLVDAAFPGMLPVINEFCVKQAIKTGIGLNAKINKRSVFDRKNYFYADLPQGYQISQFKANTDDMRDSSSLKMIPALLKKGAKVNYFDPTGLKKEFSNLKNVFYIDNIKESVQGSDLVIIHTEWNDFKSINFKNLVRGKKFIIYDMRNIYSPMKIKNQGFKYYSVGR